MKKVSVIGLGYIGLPTAAMFASYGLKVIGIDVNTETCRIINNGGVHIKEPHLGEIIQEQVARGMIICDNKVRSADAFLITVPTPLTEETNADLSYVINAGEKIAGVLKKGDLVVLESTVPPRTTVDVLLPVLEESGLRGGQDFYLAHCPERVLPGKIIHELQYNNRIIGGIDQESAVKAKKLYSIFVKGKMYLTDTITAELCKLMENTYRDVNIALANELAKICEVLGSNVWDVIEYANKHPRVNLHQPGPGVGGHCLAIDPWFIVKSAPDISPIIELARRTNDFMPEYVASKVKNLVAVGSKIVILGCTYKPDIDDLRESPVMALVEILNKDYKISVVDPFVDKYNINIYEAARDANLVLLGVHHQKFAEIDLGLLANLMETPILLDTRNFFSSKAKQAGFEYYLLGTPVASQTGLQTAMMEVRVVQKILNGGK